MSDNKKYYYLKLKENFFDTEEMLVLQSMPEGYIYSDILMKLYLRSLKNNGKLMFKDVIPYTPEILATVVRHQVGTVKEALNLFQQLGLVEILNSGAIYMSDLQNFIGESSTEADRKRLYRAKIESEKNLRIESGGQMSNQTSEECPDKNPPELEIELEQELEKKKDKELEIEKHFSSFWSIYPKKTDKKRALKTFKVAIKHHPIETILSGTEKYADHVKQNKTESQYIKHATTFLNNESFLNEYETKKGEVDALGYDISQYKNIF